MSAPNGSQTYTAVAEDQYCVPMAGSFTYQWTVNGQVVQDTSSATYTYDFAALYISPANFWFSEGCVGFNYWEPYGYYAVKAGIGHLYGVHGSQMTAALNDEVDLGYVAPGNPRPIISHGTIGNRSGVLSGMEIETDQVFSQLSN